MSLVNLQLTDEQRREIAIRHEWAREHVVAIKRATLDHPQMTLDDAYACQHAWVDLQVARGATLAGHKIGLTSRAMQVAMNIDEPDFGTLLDYMMHDSGVTLLAAAYLDPRIEVELSFVLGGRLFGEDVTTTDVLAATEWIVPAFELIDARSYRTDPDDGVTRGVRDTIADNAANAGVIMGSGRVRPGEVDLRWVPAILKRNGIVEETGVAAGVLDDPVQGVVWLARRLSRYGVTLEPGEVILAGSFTRPVMCTSGDTFEADFGALGVVSCHFT